MKFSPAKDTNKLRQFGGGILNCVTDSRESRQQCLGFFHAQNIVENMRIMLIPPTQYSIVLCRPFKCGQKVPPKNRKKISLRVREIQESYSDR